jgi:hypothetical protein
MEDATANQPPSLASLGKALALASGLAALVLILVVLPAERNIDPTGFGRAVGLTALSAPGSENAPLPESAPAAAPAPGTPSAQPVAAASRTDQVFVDVLPRKGIEYKFRIRAGEKLKYSWKCSQGELFYDFHGEPKGAPKDVFESYAVSTATGAKGTLTAPFEGTHGWYWKNTGDTPVRVTLDTSGAYEIVEMR